MQYWQSKKIGRAVHSIVCDLVKMKKEKIIVFICLIILSLVLIGYITIKNKKQNEQNKSFTVEMVVSDKADKTITSYCTDNNSIDILFDLIYSSNFETDGKLVILKNFHPISFTINGGAKVNDYTFKIFKTSEEMISENNTISIDLLDANLNDICVLLFVKDDIFTCRFQIENSSIKNDNKITELRSTYNLVADFGEKAQFFSSLDTTSLDEGVLSILDGASDNFYCAIDLEKMLENTSVFNSYKKREKELSKYAIVPILNNQIIGEVFYCESTESRFAFKINTTVLPPFDNVKFIIFPYPNEFKYKYLKTYKAFLWSDPFITYNLFYYNQEERK